MYSTTKTTFGVSGEGRSHQLLGTPFECIVEGIIFKKKKLNSNRSSKDISNIPFLYNNEL